MITGYFSKKNKLFDCLKNALCIWSIEATWLMTVTSLESSQINSYTFLLYKLFCELDFQPNVVHTVQYATEFTYVLNRLID